jgi:hypothetical protein
MGFDRPMLKSFSYPIRKLIADLRRTSCRHQVVPSTVCLMKLLHIVSILSSLLPRDLYYITS